VDISATRDGTGARIMVSDGGPVVPAATRTDLLEHQVDPTSLGRPPGPTLLVAQVVTAYLGGTLKLAESRSTGGALVEAFVAAS
jgi:C4-dicarboxylate-specific signal transduction histidine kinase